MPIPHVKELEERMKQPKQVEEPVNKKKKRGGKRKPHVRELEDQMKQPLIKQVEEKIKEISKSFENMDAIKKNPSQLRQLFADAKDCAKKMGALQMPGADVFKDVVNLAEKDYKSELQTAARRAAYADSHKDASTKKQVEKTIELPKPKPK
jgi:hypothetical protein